MRHAARLIPVLATGVLAASPAFAAAGVPTTAGNLLTADGTLPAADFLPAGAAEVGVGLGLGLQQNQWGVVPRVQAAINLGGAGDVALLPDLSGEDLVFRRAIASAPGYASGWQVGVAYRPIGQAQPGLVMAGSPYDLLTGGGRFGAVATYLAAWDLGLARATLSPGLLYDPVGAVPHLTLGAAADRALNWHDLAVGAAIGLDERMSDDDLNSNFALGARWNPAGRWYGSVTWEETLFGGSSTLGGTILLGAGYRFGATPVARVAPATPAASGSY